MQDMPIGHSTVKPDRGSTDDGDPGRGDVAMVKALQAAVGETWLLAMTDFSIICAYR